MSDLYNRTYEQVDHYITLLVRIDPITQDNSVQKATLFIDDIELANITYTFCRKDILKSYMDVNSISDTLVLPYDANHQILLSEIKSNYSNFTSDGFYFRDSRYSYNQIMNMKLSSDADINEFEINNTVKGYGYNIVRAAINNFFYYLVNSLSAISSFIYFENVTDTNRTYVEYYNNYQSTEMIFSLKEKFYEKNNFTYRHPLQLTYNDYLNKITQVKNTKIKKMIRVFNNSRINVKPFVYFDGTLVHYYNMRFKRLN